MVNLKSGKEVVPGIVVYDNVINNSKKLIEMAKSSPEKWRDSRIGPKISENVDKKIRNTMIMDIPGIYNNDIEWFKVSQTIWQYANEYAIKFNVSFSNMEHAQLLHYSKNSGFYKTHIDSGPGVSRIFSAVLYLNDVKRGGETYFDQFDVSVSAKEGRLVLFPATYPYSHQALIPESNDKFAIVTWFQPLNWGTNEN